MTRQDHKALAAALKLAMPRPSNRSYRTDDALVGGRIAWALSVRAIAAVLEQDNPRFSRLRFEAECGLNEAVLNADIDANQEAANE